MKNIIIKTADLDEMETRHRAAFVNSLGGFKSAVLIGTKNKEGLENLAIFNSLIHIGANPALCAFIVRPDVSPRHTLENIIETGYYTINHLNTETYQKAHQTSARYPRETSEFEATGLATAYLEDFFAPFVENSHVKFGCEFVERINIELNGTSLIIGKIVYISVPENCVEDDSFVDIEKAGTVTVSGLDSYHTTKRLARMEYAKPDKLPLTK
ncbi:flavin oxidoreductase [Lacihabitans sp. LS3-19]|uniref:flavin reductase family protein n=1 Tax=Lacihabitans sp. LS3-19 TaxID=2487335 RepID=UPI0020CD187F|nr:flavin reductase [Lacihabitans sp. LS3-19]MCP9766937.1 flavin oxidoreductase [Lacihabitans sp. LS3-19]